MNKRHYEHTLPNIRGSLSNTYDGKPDGGKVQLPANDGLLQREAAECETDGDAGRRAEGQVGEVRQGDGEVLLLRHPAGAETGVEDVA